jgi:glycosyltransferase involved in cell wall biosynthesis
VIATPTAGQREVLRAAPEAGMVIDITQTTALAQRLDTLIADPAARTKLGQAARRAAEERFCWEKESPMLLEHVAAALARR